MLALQRISGCSTTGMGPRCFPARLARVQARTWAGVLLAGAHQDGLRGLAAGAEQPEVGRGQVEL
ncbi:hypothetical protein ABZV34_37290 [Streptomyces sp. NPDC005195]|uniref:hypothetical protein n=1 Tax=Streptomyces sp. NPDC005195 TaxID=3154561 RepID=UPI0033A1C38C